MLPGLLVVCQKDPNPTREGELNAPEADTGPV